MVRQPGIVDILDTGIRAQSLRQKVVANNIANLNTANFRRSEVKFEDMLADAIDSPSQLTRLHEIEGEVYQPHETPVDPRGNDVNLDLEVGEMLKAVSRHKTYVKLLKKMYSQMELAMQDR